MLGMMWLDEEVCLKNREKLNYKRICKCGKPLYRVWAGKIFCVECWKKFVENIDAILKEESE